MQEIAGYIYEGARPFCAVEYRILVMFMAVAFLFALVENSGKLASPSQWWIVIMLAGLFGMQRLPANVRTSQAAKDEGR
jgi:Na+/H+-translocating membrane pyrophosphatase